MAKLTGTNPDQVPTNADLGTMAYQDKDNLQVGNVYADGILKLDQGAGHIIVKHDGVNGSISNNTGQLLVYAEGSGDIISHTNGVERMRIKSSGNVGIGTQSPSAKLHISETAPVLAITAENNSSGLRINVLGQTGGELLRVQQDGSTKLEVEYGTGEVKVSSGLLELNGNDIGGTQVTIADDAVASITPPRNGGFMTIILNGNSDFPQQGHQAMLRYDVGSSLAIDETAVGGGSIDTTTSDVSGTTGTDGNTTVAVQTGVIKIENRSGSSGTYQITFL